ncbi:MAG TPA: type III-A CRISPR-associated RAMP protein Csm3 [Candidatus Kapabacteria bacterium]|nr:type III-A CRISPR-associated RAMP protein Csm3 [Candidatus Kapabacteria bacterium]
MKIEFLGNIILRGKIECLTGLHIGGSKDKLEIGGVDSPVIRDPFTQYPYIPGSSLKGKMRTLLAYHLGKADIDPPEKKNFDSNSSLQRIFGVPAEVAPKEEAIGPTRLIVRDAHPDQETVMMWKNLDSELMYTEYKPENTINKITSAANPRFLERVVKGSCFNFEMIFGVYKLDNCEKQDIDFFKDLLLSMKLLEHNTLGGSGSRGYGKISFKLEEPYVLTRADYLKPDERFKNSLKDIDVTFDKDKYLRLSDFTDEKLAGIMNKFKNL